MKDPFDWDAEDSSPRLFKDEDWPDDDYEADAEDGFDGYDGLYSHDSTEDDYREEYPEDDF
jgi:hypothetical protein